MNGAEAPSSGDPRRVALAALLLGATAQLAQVLVFREIMAVCHGAEILFGAVLGGGLAWTALGSAAAALLIRKRTALPAIRAALVVLAAVTGLLLAGEIFTARLLAGWGAAAAGQILSLSRSAVLAMIIPAPVAAASGAMFVLALRTQPAQPFAVVYRWESWGAVLGGLAFTFLLVHVAGPIRTALVSGLIFAAGAYALLRPIPPAARWVLIAGIVTAAALSLLPLESLAERVRWRGLLAGYELLAYRDTPYGRVCALARPGGEQVSIYHNGALAASLEPAASVSDSRPRADLCAALHPAPRRALVVGETLGAFPAELLRHDLERVDAVELDPALFELADRFGPARDRDPRLHRIASDGRTFIKRAPAATYDLVIVSAGEPDSATVNRYCTVEFFGEVRRCLTEAGVLVLFVPTYGAAAEYTGEALARRTASIRGAMAEVFGGVRAAPVHGLMLAAANASGRVTLDPAELGRRLAARPKAAPAMRVASPGGTEEVPVPAADYFGAIFGGVLGTQTSLDGRETQPHIENLENVLNAFPGGINRDTHPVAVAESLAFGAQATGADLRSRDPYGGPSLASLLREWGPWTAAAPAVAAFIAALAAGAGARLRRRPAPPPAPFLLAAFAAGLFGMAVEVALLSAYQNVRGYVYAEIGGIVASFMAGLAAGAWLGQRMTRKPKATLAAAVAAMGVLAVAVPAAVAGLGATVHPWLAAAGFWALMILAGVIDGAAFPPLVALGTRKNDAAFGGWAYAIDLVGASLGALCCGAVWVPMLGLTWAMLAVAGVTAAALVAILWSD